MTTVKIKLFKKYLEKYLSLGWLHISEKTLLKTVILLVQELRILGKLLVFCPTLSLILPIFGESKKGKLYINEKMLILIHSRRYYKNMHVIALPGFLTCFYFA